MLCIMGLFDSLRGKQSAPAPTELEPVPPRASDDAVVFSPQVGARVPRPASLPTNAIWIYGRETRMSADESHFPRVFRSLVLGTVYAVELSRGRLVGWRKPIAIRIHGASVGVVANHPIRSQIATAATIVRPVFAPAMIEMVHGKKVLVTYLCSDTAFAAWLHRYRKTIEADYEPPTIEQSLGKQGVVYHEARDLLGKRDRHTFRAKVVLESPIPGDGVGLASVVLMVRGKRVAEVSASQREQMPELFEVAARGGKGALTVGVGSTGELWGYVAAY